VPLPFHPPPGQIVICDFDGFKEPEIVKRRPAIIVSPRLRGRDGLCSVLPISTTAPRRELPHHFQLTIEPALPAPYGEQQVWVKCDMVCTVGFHRMNLPWYKDSGGARQYVNQYVDPDDLLAIQRCMLGYLGFADLARYL
jgi:mRNA interferase MazF